MMKGSTFHMMLGGALGGCLLGTFGGALVGVLHGLLVNDISHGLDGALLGAALLALAGAVYGGILGPPEERSILLDAERRHPLHAYVPAQGPEWSPIPENRHLAP